MIGELIEGTINFFMPLDPFALNKKEVSPTPLVLPQRVTWEELRQAYDLEDASQTPDPVLASSRNVRQMLQGFRNTYNVRTSLHSYGMVPELRVNLLEFDNDPHQPLLDELIACFNGGTSFLQDTCVLDKDIHEKMIVRGMKVVKHTLGPSLRQQAKWEKLMIEREIDPSVAVAKKKKI